MKQNWQTEREIETLRNSVFQHSFSEMDRKKYGENQGLYEGLG